MTHLRPAYLAYSGESATPPDVLTYFACNKLHDQVPDYLSLIYRSIDHSYRGYSAPSYRLLDQTFVRSPTWASLRETNRAASTSITTRTSHAQINLEESPISSLHAAPYALIGQEEKKQCHPLGRDKVLQFGFLSIFRGPLYCPRSLSTAVFISASLNNEMVTVDVDVPEHTDTSSNCSNKLSRHLCTTGRVIVGFQSRRMSCKHDRSPGLAVSRARR